MSQSLYDQALRVEKVFKLRSLDFSTPQPLTPKKRMTHAERTALWIHPETGIFRKRDMAVRFNSKRVCLLETVYGCASNGALCPWGCYAKFSCKKLNARFDVTVPQILNEKTLLPQLERVKKKWGYITIGSMGDPSYAWTGVDGEHCTVSACELAAKAGVVPVPFTKFWNFPSNDERLRLIESGSVVHATISALDSDAFLRPRINEARKYLSLGGRWVWRVVTFYFDDTKKEGQDLWDRQDGLMRTKLGAVIDNAPFVLENPARLMKGEKEGNPLWGTVIPEWAYHKAPTTKDHKFSPHNHNWTSGCLYSGKFAHVEVPACWVGCRDCDVECLWRKDKQTSMDDFTS